MRCTDACVHPHPVGDSSLRRMALDAGELGFDSLVAVGAAGSTCRGVEIVGGTLLQGRDAREVQAAVRRTGQRSGILMVNAGDYTFNRAILHIGGIRVLRDIQSSPKNSFDHILSRTAAERQMAVDLNFSPLVRGRDYVRQKVLHRYADLVRLQSRFEFPLTISSGARSILEMKSPRDMVALGRLFGLDKEGVGQALMSISRLLHPENPVEVVE